MKTEYKYYSFQKNKNYLPIYDVLKYISEQNSEEIKFYIHFFNKEMNSSRKWFELIFCILAGTQVKSYVVKKAFNLLINNIS
ncbi:MAG: hypothetical protein ACTSRG_26800, partial [Candidatus Helarchaeota archaeon]